MLTAYRLLGTLGCQPNAFQKAIESLVFAHIFTALPKEVHVRGPGYILTGSEWINFAIFEQSLQMWTTGRKPWESGKTLSLNWGENVIRPCEDKWNFVFEVEELHTIGEVLSAWPCYWLFSFKRTPAMFLAEIIFDQDIPDGSSKNPRPDGRNIYPQAIQFKSFSSTIHTLCEDFLLFCLLLLKK